MKRGQISIEYLILIGFLMFILISILGIAMFYMSGIRDRMKISQITAFASKLTSTAESAYYAGSPSKATITAYLPSEVKAITIIENSLIFEIQTDSGLTKMSFSSNVPISGAISTASGLKKIIITAQNNEVVIS